ncbi:MAG: hypothetical protein ACE5SW_04625 [Nitrososphaeraceae archaeon]
MFAFLPPPLMIKVIWKINAQEFNLNQFKDLIGVTNNDIFKDILRFLEYNKIGKLSNNNKLISFSDSDKIRMILKAIQMGCDIQTCSKLLSWKDFESLTSEILIKFDYQTKVNIYMSKPRYQLDVVATKNNFLLSIDCKHWRKYSKSAIIPYIEKQVIRTRNYLINYKKIKRALPMLITLYDSSFKLICGVPIVPIQSLQSFLLEFETIEDELYYIYN